MTKGRKRRKNTVIMGENLQAKTSWDKNVEETGPSLTVIHVGKKERRQRKQNAKNKERIKKSKVFD